MSIFSTPSQIQLFPHFMQTLLLSIYTRLSISWWLDYSHYYSHSHYYSLLLTQLLTLWPGPILHLSLCDTEMPS